jgi:hypothetical protein
LIPKGTGFLNPFLAASLYGQTLFFPCGSTTRRSLLIALAQGAPDVDQSRVCIAAPFGWSQLPNSVLVSLKKKIPVLINRESSKERNQ